MPRGRELNEQMRAEALAKITNAAIAVFAEYGYHGATMKRIAEVSSLSYGLVYHYFPSKEKVFRYLVDFAIDGSLAGLRGIMDAPGDATAWERIEAHAAMVVGTMFSGESSLYFLIMLQAMTQGKGILGFSDQLADRLETYYQIMVPFIARAQKTGEAAEGDPEVLAAAYFSFIQGLATLAFQGKGLEKKITPGILVNVLRSGGRLT